MFVPKPQKTEYHVWYENYVRQTPEGDILELLRQNQAQTKALFSQIPASKADFAYEKGKWTIKQVLGHIIDSERVFAFRLFWFLRQAGTPMPSFEQDEFMKNAGFEHRSLDSLIAEFVQVRESSLFTVSEVRESDWAVEGVMSGNSVTIRAMLYILAGHEIHHINILKERYLPKL